MRRAIHLLAVRSVDALDRVAGKQGVGAGIGIADVRRFVENLLHALIGRERFALDDADSGDLAAQFRVQPLDGFFLYQRIQLLIKTVVSGRDGIVPARPLMLINSMADGLPLFASG